MAETTHTITVKIDQPVQDYLNRLYLPDSLEAGLTETFEAYLREIAARYDDFIARFFAKVNKEGAGGCWLWTGSLAQAGYGKSVVPGKRGWEHAHRISYRLFNGEIPAKLFVRHTCDVKACVNPAHLILGTHRENVADAVERDRYEKRSWHHSSKLSEEQVAELKHLRLDEGWQYSRLAAKFGITATHASKIVRGLKWRR